jgi:hypothetical protein
MFRKVAIAGATAAVIVGAGTAALATTGDNSGTSGTPSTATTAASSTTAKAGNLSRFARRHPGIAALISHHAVHGQIVTSDGNGKYTTHDGILGTVSAVSSTSITIKSGDGFVQTYVINSSTKVRVRPDGKNSTIGQVHVGDSVGVVGTGTGSPLATYVVEGAN